MVNVNKKNLPLKMDIKPHELPENGYVLLDKLGHRDLVPFIQAYMKKRTKYSFFYYFINLVIFAIAGYLCLSGFNQPGYSFGHRLTQFCYGLAIAIALLPLHEYIHVLAYRFQGAVNTSYDANLKKFYFMALADGFVASRREFEMVALAPFCVITAAFTGLLLFVNTDWNLRIVAVLLAHTAMCSGDFGLLSYVEFHKDKGIVTYDDVEGKTTYFYRKANDGEMIG